ncbi:MAG: hypothetical protein IJ292_04250 [Clostridia bacterium]|jgi:hypothetical protein|nr:hypothetical protein [Clostridia bacterium]
MNGANGLEDIISKLTENPEMMKSLMNVAGNIMNEGQSAPKNDAIHNDVAKEHDRPAPPKKKRGDDAENLICLLLALKPYVSAERCEKIDSIVKILKLVQLSEKTGLLKSLL